MKTNPDFIETVANELGNDLNQIPAPNLTHSIISAHQQRSKTKTAQIFSLKRLAVAALLLISLFNTMLIWNTLKETEEVTAVDELELLYSSDADWNSILTLNEN